MLIGLSNCQTLNIGRCPTVEVKKDFDLAKVSETKTRVRVEF
jgi:hypothetical protein